MSVIIHREHVKAAIRVEHGSLEAFADHAGLKSQQVRDTLRGTSSSALLAIAKLLGANADHLKIVRGSTLVECDNTAKPAPHRLNSVGR